jgi:hypothetical protein
MVAQSKALSGAGNFKGHDTFSNAASYSAGSANTCKSSEFKNAKAAFVPNDNIYFGIAMRDFLQNQFFTISVYYPNGSLWFSEPYGNTTGADQTRRYVTVFKQIPGGAMSGTYKVVVDFYGSTAVHFLR